MAKYEVTILFSKEQKETKKMAETLFKAAKVTVEKTHDWKVRELAYPIKKQLEAYFWHFEVEADAKQALDLQRQLQLAEKALRFLIVKTK